MVSEVVLGTQEENCEQNSVAKRNNHLFSVENTIARALKTGGNGLSYDWKAGYENQ